MKNYLEFILLGLLLVLVYKKPNFLKNIPNNKILIVLLILLNGYIAKKHGMTCGIIMALIIIVLIDDKESFCGMKEGFNPKIQVWRPASFSGPCQTDLDRRIKVNSELANLSSTKQLNGQTNDGYKTN